MQLALTGGDLGPVTKPLLIDLGRGEVPLDQVRRPPPALARAGRGPALLLPPRCQALLTHQGGDGVLAHPPAVVMQVVGDPRGAVFALVGLKQPLDLDSQPPPALSSRR
jgi:hypothetical protein